ncbi:thiol:disulfide interchange protein DsbD [Balneicella halophila]|uniref:Thiol:disulfide interchange protein DsbD n=1 Tax=Balneicella halophila TaxID=1537566 RepID=A0A7L4UQA6_BALHA|nr:thioredoxin family protein [Balneicella halophila]PVX51968.1 thiol:disulfide interchange protein DsbD [Balneicella halophila]
MIKKIGFLASLLFVTAFTVFAQMYNPVSWEFDSKKISDNEYELIFYANIDEGSSMYSQHIDEGGPIPTTFNFEDSESFELIGKTIESENNRETKHDDIFDMELTKFHDQAVFTQKIKVLDINKPIKGFVRFMSCDDTQCTPPTEEEFLFTLSEEAATVAENESEDDIVIDAEKVNMELYGMVPGDIMRTDKNCGITDDSQLDEEDQGIWTIFILGFLGGLIALLTPCVFPMIPLTVSFFTKQSAKGNGTRNAILYGFFILLVYLLLSIPFHLLDTINPDILNDISTNIWLNIAFFVIFIFFAFSFFGYYELTLPNSWMAKTSSAEGAGGIIGIFFMALTLALVSFSCTGPILGSLLAGSLSSDGGAWQLTSGMAGFGVALGLPFALFAMFPNWLNKMPKSGGWLNTVKVVLGFLELALALKFLSNADLVKNWGILKIETFLVLWIIIFAAMALYLFGVIRFPHDSKLKKLSATRITLGLITAAFTVYLVSGLFYSEEKQSYPPLKILSGLAPPVGYSIFHPKHCPNNLQCFDNLKDGLAYAKSANKPVLLDFTGFACVNCRKMEEHVWSVSSVDKIIRNEYVLISLHIDDKRDLPETEQVYVNRINGGKRLLENYGHKWAHFQTAYFNSNSQPFYVLMDYDGKTLLTQPIGYTSDHEDFETFLNCGLESFKNKSTLK